MNYFIFSNIWLDLSAEDKMRGNFIISLVKFYSNLQTKFDKLDRKIRLLMHWLPHHDISFLSQIYEKKTIALHF